MSITDMLLSHAQSSQKSSGSLKGHEIATYLKDHLRWRVVVRFQQKHENLILGAGYWIRGCWQGFSLSAMFILNDKEEEVS